MYSAVIIDDERAVVEGILANVDWDALGLKVVGTASDGDEGLELVYRTEPDLLISDIRMPSMDGLEMCRILHNADIYPQIVFVSGYDDHDYARQALSLAAVDYILKPFNPKDLERILKRCVERLAGLATNTAGTDHRNVQSILGGWLLGELGSISDEQLHQVREEYLSPDFGYFGVVVVHLDQAGVDDHRSDEVQVVRECRKLLRSEHDGPEGIARIAVDIRQEHRAAVLIASKSRRKLEWAGREFAAAIREKLTRTTGKNVLCGVSEVTDELTVLPELFLHAKKALHLCYFDQDNYFHSYDSLPDTADRTEPEFIQEQIVSFVRTRDVAACHKVISELFMHYTLQEEDVFQLLKLECIKICNLIESKLPLGVSALFAEEIKDAELIIMRSKSFREVYDTMLDLTHGIADQENNPEVRTDVAIKSAIAYIHEHLAEPITLSQVAGHAHCSDSRFSVKFSHVVGEPFSRYLARQRVHRAMEIFRETPYLKVYQVAEMVGYTNSQYFSTLFKKTTGVTPLQFVGSL